MKKEVTMTMILLLILIAVSLCFRQILLRPAEGFLNVSYIAALIAVGVALLVLFGVFIKRLFAGHA